MSFLPLHDETIFLQYMFHGISDKCISLQTLHFVPTISFYQYYVQAHQHSALGPNKLLPLEFMDDTGFPSEFPQAKAQQKFTVESIFLQLLLYMILIHTINDEPYSMGSKRRKPAMNGQASSYTKKLHSASALR